MKNLRSLHLTVLIFSPMLLAGALGGWPINHPLLNSLRNASYVSLALFLSALLVPSFRKALREAFLGEQNFTAVERDEPKIVSWILVFFGFVYMKATLLDYLTFHANAIDLSMYDYALMNTLGGRFFHPVDGAYSHFGVHFTPTLLLLLPLHALFHSPIFTLMLHPLLLWVGGALYYRLILQPEIENALSRIFLLFAYFNCIWLGLVLHFHFHVEVLYFPLTFLLVAFLKSQRWWRLGLTAVLYLGVKEDAPFYLAGILLGATVKKWIRWPIGVLGVGLSAAYAVFVLKFAIPHYSSGDYRLVPAATGYGTDVPSVLRNLAATLPEYILGLTRGGWVKASYQLLFIPWLDSFFAVACLPFIAIHNLAFGGTMRAMHMHYSSPFVPLLFIGLAQGFSRLWATQYRKRAVLVLGVAVLVASLSGGGYLVFRPKPRLWQTVSAIDKEIPLTSSICTQPDALPHFRYRADRVRFYQESCLTDRVENLVFQESFASFNANPEVTRGWIEALRRSTAYELMREERGWFWFRLRK